MLHVSLPADNRRLHQRAAAGSSADLPAAESDPPASPSAAAKSLLGEQLLREIEPDLHGRPERLPVYLQRFRRAVIRDSRLFAFEARGMARRELRPADRFRRIRRASRGPAGGASRSWDSRRWTTVWNRCLRHNWEPSGSALVKASHSFRLRSPDRRTQRGERLLAGRAPVLVA